MFFAIPAWNQPLRMSWQPDPVYNALDIAHWQIGCSLTKAACPSGGLGVIKIMSEIGQTSPESGRYRCAICGAEIHVEAGEVFPACTGKDHSPRWVLCEELILSMAGAGR